LAPERRNRSSTSLWPSNTGSGECDMWGGPDLFHESWNTRRQASLTPQMQSTHKVCEKRNWSCGNAADKRAGKAIQQSLPCVRSFSGAAAGGENGE
jgi:hypothetical protein